MLTFYSPGFYVTFWQLSTYDLIPPGAKYDEEGSTLRALSRQEDAKYIAADRSADRAKRLTASSHRVRRARYNDFVNLLAQEYKEQAASRAFTIKRLAREKQHWFAGGVCVAYSLTKMLTATLRCQGHRPRFFFY
jgi:THO complex subunit 2